MRHWCAVGVVLSLGGVARAQDTIVNGPRPTATTGDTSVERSEIRALSAQRGDDLFRLVPGLLTSQHGAEGHAMQLYLRGFDAVHGADLEVRVAGIPVNELSNVHGQGYLDLGFVLPETVRRIDMRKGAFGLPQGIFGVAGSLGFELAVPDRGQRLGYELGTTNRHRVLALIAPRGLPDATYLAAEVMHDDGFGENRASRRFNLQGQAALGRRMRLFAAGYDARFGEPGVLPLAEIEAGRLDRDDALDDGLGISRRLLTSLAYRGRSLEAMAWLGWRYLRLDENFTGFLVDEARGDQRVQRHRAGGGGASVAWQHRLGRGWRIFGGGEARAEHVRQREDQVDGDGVVWRENRRLDGTQGAGGAYAGVAGWIAGWIRLEGGARVDGFAAPDGAVAAISPRLATAFRLSPALTLFAAAGRGVRAPEARALAGEGGFTQATELETGGRGELGEVTLALAGFATWVSRESIFDHVSGANLEVNATRRLGAELSTAWRPRPWLRAHLDATTVDARFTGSGAPIPGAPQLLVVAGVELTGPLSASARVTLLGPRPLPHDATAKAGVLVELGGAYRWDRFTFSLRVDNALDSDWREGEFHFASWFDKSTPRSALPRIHLSPGPPITLRAGLSVSL
jgi:iron complex outermembrane recepter protein